MYIVVIGCNMYGRKVARQLSSEDNDVVVIDNNNENINRFHNNFDGIIIKGLEFDRNILETAKVEQADYIVICTDDENKNIMIAQVLNKIYGINNIILCLQSISMAKLYKDSPFKIVCLTSVISNEILQNFNDKENK